MILKGEHDFMNLLTTALQKNIGYTGLLKDNQLTDIRTKLVHIKKRPVTQNIWP